MTTNNSYKQLVKFSATVQHEQFIIIILYKEMKKMKEKMQGYHEMYLTGSREIYQVW